MKLSRILAVLIIMVLVSLVAADGFAIEGVSPGAVDRMAQVNNACPTFNWEVSDGTALYELVAYRLPEETQTVELIPEIEVLFARVSGSATGWTPSANQCFAAGGRFVWFVRSVTEMIDDQVIEASEWSAGRYFNVPPGPSAEEVARAVEVLKNWEAANGGGSLMLSSGAAPAAATDSGSGSRTGTGSNHRKSVPTAAAAIRGENPETDVEAYGVVGSSASVYGAGVAAVNTEGGADLVLDGSIDGMPDTRLSEWGIDRSDPTDQVFAMTNSGGGAMTLDVFGTVRGTGLECPMCVDSTDIADGTIIDNDLADDSVIESKIEHGAINTNHLQNGAVTSAKILDGSVSSADLADDAVTAAEIADGAVGAAHIGFEVVGESNLADEAVSNAKIAAGAVEGVHLGNNVVTSAKISAGAVDTTALRNNAVTTDKIAAATITTAKLAAGSVGSGQIVAGAVDGTKIATGAVGANQLAGNSVSSAAIIDGAVTSDDLASASVNSTHILNMSVDTAELAPGAVTSSKIEDGTLIAADVDPAGGIYASKTSIYYSTDSSGIEPGECVIVDAHCADENDLGLHSSCGLAPSTPMYVRTTSADNWDNLSVAASWSCDICFNVNGSGAATVTSSILCIAVPGP